jgi:hypothetical protein
MPACGDVARGDLLLWDGAEVREELFQPTDALASGADMAALLAVEPALVGERAVLLEEHGAATENVRQPGGRGGQD